jgi:hypothetical protein
VSDIFNEVDEEVRREQLKKLWERYGTLVIALAVLVVVGAGGWRGYQWWENRKAAEAGAAFDAAAALVDEGRQPEAEAAFDRIASQGAAGYRTLARLRAAAAIGDRDPKAAVAAYDAVANDNSTERVMRDLAGVRAGMLLVDSMPLAEITQRLEPLTQPDRPFRHTARELLALASWKANDAAAVKKWAEAIQGDPETPPAIRARVEALTAMASESGKG